MRGEAPEDQPGTTSMRNAIRRTFLAPRKLVPPRVCVNQAAITQLSRAERDFRVAGSRLLIMRPKRNARNRYAQSRQNDSAIYRRNGNESVAAMRRYPSFFEADEARLRIHSREFY